jgi:3-deoxy-D-manno-octulosonate 8-phosphate phosphatase (KDO 8-P phosphatase)
MLVHRRALACHGRVVLSFARWLANIALKRSGRMPSIHRPQKTLPTARLSLQGILRRVRLFATDVDGVLTDGGMYYSESGDEWKKFNTRDGMGIKLLQRAGILTAIITQESTKIVMRRAQKLTIPEVHQGIFDKLALLKDLIARHDLTLEQVAYIGDDVNDMQALGAVGFSASPADGMPPVLKTVRYVCKQKGGEGAVREVADLILAAQQPR